jgi:hypothetical protein
VPLFAVLSEEVNAVYDAYEGGGEADELVPESVKLKFSVKMSGLSV